MLSFLRRRKTGDNNATEQPSEVIHQQKTVPDSEQNVASSGNGPEPTLVLAKTRFSTWTYVALFVILDIIGVGLLQWGVTISSSRVALSSPLIGFWGFISSMWSEGRFVFILNLIILSMIYLIILMICNRFWVASPIFLTICAGVAVAEHLKAVSRYEAIMPADLNFLQSNTGNIVSFLPAGAQWTIVWAVVSIVVLIALCVFINRMDLRRGRVFTTSDKRIGAICRVMFILVPAMALTLFAQSVSTVGTWSYSMSKTMGDIPSMWDSVYDAQRNGTLVAFMRQLNPKVMDEPSGYSEANMKKVAKRYQQEAEQINTSRSSYLNDSTVIYVLSESFSDPTRVPGISINKDPMPNIRSIKQQTTSGLMLSSGYGGGTANLEFQQITGLSMANFDASLTSPYQQLVPSLSWTPTINQIWGSSKNSLAFHPYESSMYSRAVNYKKFGFSNFYTLDGENQIQYQNKIDQSPYVSDESAYNSALGKITSGNTSQFLQIITMQNHMPYNNWYNNNEFKVTASTGASALGSDETMSIDTYAKGVSITDTATKSFLNSLNAIDKPITVVFYGDHLPGIYTTAGADANNSLALHETDYFIWSNDASTSSDTKLQGSNFSSPNFFMAQTAEHMNAKVSPYLAFLTQLHSKIAAMEPPVVNQIQGWDRIPEGQTIYLDNSGNPMDATTFDAKTKQLVNDYKLIQYDITAGNHYLQGTGFMTAPSKASEEKAAKAAAAKAAKEAQKAAEKQSASQQAQPSESTTSSSSESSAGQTSTSGK
ncbi:LTA synthase family protein [Bifidobacterium sp.]|jgi:phosphoglycerol transferase MdoB-like AlkP superfamily enzyme|uniref:LTA synthase family protein n=1 Tax=Bifidobacterium sp. TaxID=41200 RepID=UPI0025C4957A|nr:alkaline phosphatase family protein [Bifidobacterium sp.]MCI1635478.1 sulfatase-like hydrolase/transferase [Bifidobacterium sp.]